MGFLFCTNFFTIICLSIFSNTLALYPQYIQFYEDASCFGNYEYSFVNVSNPGEFTPILQHPGSISWRGMWTLRTPEGLISGPDDYQSECAVPRNRTTIEIFKHLDSDLDESEIALYTQYRDSWNGPRVNIKTESYSFVEPILVRQYVFTGIKPYTVFEGTNFDGNETCLEVNQFSLPEYALTFYYQVYYQQDTLNLTVGSLRIGCSETAVYRIPGNPGSLTKLKQNVDGIMKLGSENSLSKHQILTSRQINN